MRMKKSPKINAAKREQAAAKSRMLAKMPAAFANKQKRYR